MPMTRFVTFKINDEKTELPPSDESIGLLSCVAFEEGPTYMAFPKSSWLADRLTS